MVKRRYKEESRDLPTWGPDCLVFWHGLYCSRAERFSQFEPLVSFRTILVSVDFAENDSPYSFSFWIVTRIKGAGLIVLRGVVTGIRTSNANIALIAQYITVGFSFLDLCGWLLSEQLS